MNQQESALNGITRQDSTTQTVWSSGNYRTKYCHVCSAI